MKKFDENGNEYLPIEVTASLRVFGDDVDPDQISQLLGCQPSRSYRPGEKTYKGLSAPIAKAGHWALESRLSRGDELESHLKDIFSQITDDVEIWRKLTTKYNVDVFVGLFMNVHNSGFELSKEATALLSDRTVTIGFDIYSK